MSASMSPLPTSLLVSTVSSRHISDAVKNISRDAVERGAVAFAKLDPEGMCHQAGMMLGSALVEVCGKAVKSHQHAIELLEAESTDMESMQFTFEVVVRESSDRLAAPVIQSL